LLDRTMPQKEKSHDKNMTNEGLMPKYEHEMITEAV
jgi:hypothetical protein